MDIHDRLGVLRRGLALTVLGAVVGVGLGVVAQSAAPATYSATSRDLVAATRTGGVALSPSRVASYVLVASSGLVLQPVIDRLGLDTTVDELAQRLVVVAPPSETSVIEITATASTPREAQAIAAAVSDEFSDVAVAELEGSSASASAPVRIVSLEDAAVPSAPDARDSLPVIIIGAAGLVLGLLLAVLRQILDRRVRTPRDVAAVTGVPVIGRIVADRAAGAGLVTRIGSRTAIADRFRVLAAEVARLRPEADGAQTIVVTASGPEHGATTVAANLAVALANTAASVVVVDADLRGAALSRIFGFGAEPGLTELLSGRAELGAALRWGGTSGLTVLPAGSVPVSPGELIATRAMHELLVDLRGRFQFVIIDSPTIASDTVAAVLGSLDSSTLLVVAQGSATRSEVEDAVSMLAASGKAPFGLVLDSVPRRWPWRRRPSSSPATRHVSGPTAAALAQTEERDRIVAQRLTEQAVRAAQPPLLTPLHPPTAAPSVASASAVVAGPRPDGADPIVAVAASDRVEPRVPVHLAPAPDPAMPVFDPPLPPELQFTGVELPIGRRRPKHQADGVDPDTVAGVAAATTDDSPAGVESPSSAPTASRFAPDPARYAQDLSVFATARPPRPETRGQVPQPPSTVVTTISVVTSRSTSRSATPPPPISRILPPAPGVVRSPSSSSDETTSSQPEPEAVRVRPSRPTRPPMPPLDMGRSRSLAPTDRSRYRAPSYEPDLDDTTISPARVNELRAARAGDPRSAEDDMGGLLGDIGGIPRVEVVSTRPIPVADLSITPAHRARESYERRSRELERAAEERLRRERRLLEAGIREQLDYGKRELETVLQNRLEDTIQRPSRLQLSGRRRRDDATDGPADD